ncbi:sensor histidine kinase [Kitasatospora sp. NA04385]|uniref:sensor histidine kinase n=1 Tax=Kitasatospora sp. NA04385 TaxID=2742135 RepID=UPI001590BFA5|nr:histidine kinase [Kitasatospora sp. NA04385]QKW19785.1 sensor histidine kinase [Kitasatospora sp. NA04385]
MRVGRGIPVRGRQGGGRGRRTAVRWAAGLLLLAVPSAFDVAQHYRSPYLADALPLTLLVLRCTPLLLVWRRPGPAAAAVCAAACGAGSALLVPVSPSEPWPWPVTSVLVQSVALVLLGLRHPGGTPARRRALAAGWAVGQLPGALLITLLPGRGGPLDLLPFAVVSAAAALVGELAGARAETARDLARERAESTAERARRVRLEERARLARELHDVVAHHLSVVVARADSAPYRIPSAADEDVREELAAIAEEARSSLNEMRRVLRLLREDAPDAAPAARAPLPGLAQLPALIDGVRDTGADVRLEAPLPDHREIAPTAQLAAFRIVQEALTNAMRHAPGAPVTVALTRRGGRLDLRVTNARPPADAATTGPGSGHGLRGIKERAATCGGTAEAGPTPGGGFRVSATIPSREGAAPWPSES